MKRHVNGSCNGTRSSDYTLVQERPRRGRHAIKLVVLLAILFALINAPWSGNDAIPVSASEGRSTPSQQSSGGVVELGPMPVGFAAGDRFEQGLGAQSFLDGLVVEEGQVLTGDITVFSGDAVVKDGGRIEGNLVVFRGDVKVEEEGFVGGDLTLWRGDAKIDGRVEGNLSLFNGDVDLDNDAWVGGDVSTLRGEIDRSDSAHVGGTVLRGPGATSPFSMNAPILPVAPVAPDAPASPDAPAAPISPPPASERESSRGFSPAASFLGLVARLFAAIFFTAISAVVAMAVFSMRPALIDEVQDELRVNRARSIGIGLATTFALYILMRLLLIAFCFAPLAVVPALLLVGLSAIGLTAQARTVGQHFMPALRDSVERKPVTEVALGAVILGGLLFILAAIFGWGEFWTIVALIVAAPAVGALIEPRFERYRNREVKDLTSPGTTAPAPNRRSTTPTSSVPATVAPAVTQPVTQTQAPKPAPAAQAVTLAVAPSQPIVSAAPAVDLGPVQSQQAGAPSAPGEGVDLGAVERTAPAGAELTVDLTLPAEPTTYQADPTLSVEDLVAAADAESARRQDTAAVAERERMARVDVARGDDFTRIRGLGRAAERKLKAAGVYSFAELASLPIEIIARVLGVPVEEVIEDQIAQQANLLVKGLA